MKRPSAQHSLFVLSIFALTVAFASTIACPTPAAADGIIIPHPPIDHPVPWRDIPLTIKYHRVTVEIVDQVATTRVDQVFVNEASYPVEGTYIFPLPEDAAISSFDMWVDGRKLEGKLLGRDEARAIYEAIVRQQRDPALLEYVGRGAFQASIFPIPAGGERRIELTYAQVLAQANGLVHYRYPLNTEKFSARNLEDVSVTVNVTDQAALRTIYSPSHAVEVVRTGESRAQVSYEARNVRPDRDFDLYYSLSRDAIAVNLLSYKSFDEDGFFLLLVTPPFTADAGAVVPKDVVLVLDTSGSMDGEKMIQAKAAAAYVLSHLGPNDRFNIVAFSSATRLFAAQPAPLTQRTEGQRFVDSLVAAGSTDIQRALLEALAGADPERPTVLIFLTDGLPTAGQTDPDRIVADVKANAAESVRLFAFGVGYDVDVTLLDELSGNQRGVSAYVQPGQKIDEEVSGFYAKISAPVLVDLQVAFAGVQVEDMVPYPLPDLFAGSQLVVAGRYRSGGVATLTLTGAMAPTSSDAGGSLASQSRTYPDLRFVERGGNEFIPRLWAQRKIGQLLAQVRLNAGKGAQKELIDEVVALSTRFGIVTPYTSFLVEEPELALSDAGREQLGQALQATQAPAAAAPARSGEVVVEKAVVERALQDSQQAAAPAASSPAGQLLRQAGDKTFLLAQETWIDTLYDASKMQAETVVFGSARYFELLARNPELGPYLALGDRVIVVLAGRAYAIAPGALGSADQPTVTPDTPAAPVTLQTPGAPVAPVVAGTHVAPTTPVTLETPAPFVTKTPDKPGNGAQAPKVCPGAALIGLMSVGLPLWSSQRRRR